MKNKKTSFQHSALQRSFPTWRNFVKAGALFATLSGLMLLGTSCGGGNEYEEVEVIDTIISEELTKGLITTVKEVQPGQFAVEDEKVVETKDSSRIIVKYLDGKTESLTIEQAKARVQPQDSLAAKDTALHVVAANATTDVNGGTTTTTTPSTKTTKSGNTTTTTTTTDDGKTVIINNTTTATPQYHSSYSPGMHTLGYVLMGSAVGYYMGKSMSMPPNPNVYRNPQQTYQAQRYSGGGSGSGGRTYAYSSLRSTAKRSVSTRTSYKSVPSSGRSGYMGKSSSSGGRSSSGGGYSG